MTASVKDMLDREIVKGDIVVFGKSNRDHPISMGVVLDLDYDKEDILIKAIGGVKPSKIPFFHSSRVIILPEHYIRFMETEL